MDSIHHILATVGNHPSKLIAILQAIQKEYHYLPLSTLKQVAQATGIHPSTITSVATFYGQFRLQPSGKHHIHVCVGTACHVAGAESLYTAFQRHLKIPDSEDTDQARQFTLHKVACLGCCTLAPVVQMDRLIYGKVQPVQVADVIQDFFAKQQKKEEPILKTIHHPAQGCVRICLCSSCVAAGADQIYEELHRQSFELNLPIQIQQVGCLGLSYAAPCLEIALFQGEQYFYGPVQKKQIRAILLKHFQPSKIRTQITSHISHWLECLAVGDPLAKLRTISFVQGDTADYTRQQQKLALEKSGILDPLDWQGYCNAQGFQALQQCLAQQTPEVVISQIQASQLRGRGGAGYPTGQKWAMVRQAFGDCKYIIANGDEGDPGAFMDRMILESFPLRVLEGMMIAAWAVGARQGYLYIRAEYPLAVERIRSAIQLCYEHHYLGQNILQTEFSLDLEIIEGAGAFVCGEETGLIQAIQGQPGRPRYRPPYPAKSGLYGSPTLINNVETFSLVPWIISQGASAFSAIGTAKSKGTKTFALAGKIKRGGLIEVPMGLSLRTIVETIGGGVAEGRTWKAVQIGGPSGGCIPSSLGHLPLDYEELIQASAMMGSGGLVVLDDTDCMVDIARYFLSFTQRESCGKCTFCRIGTQQMLSILDRICQKQGKPEDLDELMRLGYAMKQGSLCGLGKSAANPVLSTLRFFREEYEAHLHGHCPAKKCKAFIQYQITDRCIGCTKCSQACIFQAIPPTPYQQHKIDASKCTCCDNCRTVCPIEAVVIQA